MPGERAAEGVRRAQILKAAYAVAAAKGLDRLTVREVARKAKVSHGLVLFHFHTREQLVLALLDWLLATTAVLRVTDEISDMPDPMDRLHALLRMEMDRLSREPTRIRLFFDYWGKGIRHPDIRARMRLELDRYRSAFRPIAEEVLRAEPHRFSRVTPEALAAVAVSFIKGCAVQAMMDTDRFEIAPYLEAAQALLGSLAPTPADGQGSSPVWSVPA